MPYVYTKHIRDAAVTAAKLAAGVLTGTLTADVAGRAAAVMATGYFDAATTAAKFTVDSFTTAVLQQLIQDGAFSAADASRALFAANFLGNSATGRALVQAGFFDAATIQSKVAVGAITGNVIDELLIRRASGTIANADLKTMFTTPVTVIADPGVGKAVVIDSCHWFLDFGTVGFDSAAAADTLGLKYTNAAGAQILDTVAGNDIGAAVADYHVCVLPVVEVIPVVHTPVVASIDTSEWFAAAGDSVLKYEILYHIISSF